MPTLRLPCFQDRRKACYRLGRAHPWPGGIRTRWTTNKVSWRHHPPIPFDPQGLVALFYLSVMARDMPVQDLWQAHRDHLADEQSHIINPLCDNHQVALPKDLLGLLRQLHFHGTLLLQARTAWKRA